MQRISFVKYANVSPEKEFSNSQNMAIEGISSEILNSDSKPKIILLQGPPGTGKTHTIIGLLQKLIRSNTKLKILVTAPSNAAIDVIGSRLIDLNDRLSWRSQEGQMKFVRVGLPDQINSKLKPFTLDGLASKLAKDNDIKITESRKKEIEKLQLELDALKKQKFDYKN
ncbi:putative helicase senataxin [Caerostris extrusa]|uniref:Helicase senataxin n=1 Tax=Caerostris extrusa TaxID=172846 RepID=A0AAV4Y2I5_CAEEX|nr:putative helicase senataxin [Caerostris extrusa]